MRFAYADPPYIGQAKKHYKLETLCAEVDHVLLLDRLVGEYPDGWALSASSPTLREILPLCPADVRVAAWVKPFASFKPGVNPAYAWEPVVFCGGRSAKERGGKGAATVRDWHSANITLRKGLSGAKPGSFCLWVLDLLGYRHGDTLDDLYPGTGTMGRLTSVSLKGEHPRPAA